MNDENLRGARVAILESRMSDHLASLVRARGGVPISAPALRESPLECGDEVSQLIDSITGKSLHVIFFLTGVGVKSLLSEAAKLGREAELAEGLKELTIVCRGPKPSAVVRSLGINNFVAVKEPFTTADVLDLIAEMDLSSKSVALIHYGERNIALAQELESRSARLFEL
ncbi:MAG: uroporphyrinogen-III synthase, partial [Pyrinomonadaceae bacterium]